MRQDAEFIDGFVEDFGSDFLFGGDPPLTGVATSILRYAWRMDRSVAIQHTRLMGAIF